MSSYVIKKGTTSKLILLTAREGASAPAGRTGLAHDTPGASAAFHREGEAEARRFALTAGTLGTFSSGGFAEVDADLLPGVYQLGLPDAVLAEGADAAIVVLGFPDAVIEPIELALVAYDPQDADRLGMAAIGPEGRIAALRGAFPRLAAGELEAREDEGRR